ncbi:hypothetical protein NL676_019420 [Syzygium grande]|nr:hypothetical protein NL676_019420 [Syzygium grande]
MAARWLPGWCERAFRCCRRKGSRGEEGEVPSRPPLAVAEGASQSERPTEVQRVTMANKPMLGRCTGSDSERCSLYFPGLGAIVRAVANFD